MTKKCRLYNGLRISFIIQLSNYRVNNGLFLRSDVHTLFDDGYITIDKDYRIDVSRHLHEDYGNGKDYYKYHGQKLLIVPDSFREKPARLYLQWHNENVFRG